MHIATWIQKWWYGDWQHQHCKRVAVTHYSTEQVCILCEDMFRSFLGMESRHHANCKCHYQVCFNMTVWTAVIKDIIRAPSASWQADCLMPWHYGTVLTVAELWFQHDRAPAYSSVVAHDIPRSLTGCAEQTAWPHWYLELNFSGFCMWWHLKHVSAGKSRSCGKLTQGY